MRETPDTQMRPDPPPKARSRSGPAFWVSFLEASPRRALWAVALMVFCAHLGWGLWFVTASPTNMPKTSLRQQGDDYLRSFPGWDTDEESDGAFHNRAAVSVLQTGIPRTRTGAFSDHSPLYAYFLAACYKLGGVRLLSIALPQAALSALLSLLLGLVAFRLFPGLAKGSAATITALLVLPHISLANYVAYPGPPLMLMFLFAVALWAVSSADAERLGWFTTALAAGIFTHAAFFVVGGAAGLWLLFQWGRQRHARYLVAALILLAVAVVKLGISMWDTSANREEHIRKASQGLLWQGNNPYYEDMKVWDLWEQRLSNPTAWSKWQKTEQQEQRVHDYFERAGGNPRDAGLLWVRENPGQYAKLCVMRLRTELSPYMANASPPRKLLGLGYWLLVFPAGAYGLWRARKAPFGLLGGLIVLAVVVFDSLVFVNFRYRLPVEMVFTVFAGLTYAGWLQAGAGFGTGESRPPEGMIPTMS
jgi:4-amino-4-deoxy-L-arabinose transferase-like glycosyltransferase